MQLKEGRTKKSKDLLFGLKTSLKTDRNKLELNL